MSPRHRADVEVNVLEQIELRSRRQVRAAEQKPSRKSLRDAKRVAKREQELLLLEQASLGGLQARSIIQKRQIKPKLTKRRGFRSAMTMLTSAGIFSTVALPAYAFSPQEVAMAQFATANADAVAKDEKTQGLTFAATKVFVIDRLKINQTSASDLARRQLISRYASYRGPSASDFVKNPPFSQISGEAVLKVAKKYVGVPYVFGGENPNGFDCSGYVRFVFAQFGLDLPHSVIAQSRMGIVISKEDALPGDIVVLNNLSHDGIYAGAGMFYHAPRPGDTVKLAPIWTSEYFIVRLKTK